MLNFLSIQRSDDGWVFTWDGVGVDHRVVLWGQELEVTGTGTYTYSSSLYCSYTVAPPLEVVPVAGGALTVSEDNKPFLYLQWYRVDCDHYDIEYYDGGGWVNQGGIPDDPDTWIFSIITPVLEDVTETQWWVTAVSSIQRESEPLAFTYFVVRPPNVPSLPTLDCIGGDLLVN